MYSTVIFRKKEKGMHKRIYHLFKIGHSGLSVLVRNDLHITVTGIFIGKNDGPFVGTFVIIFG